MKFFRTLAWLTFLSACRESQSNRSDTAQLADSLVVDRLITFDSPDPGWTYWDIDAFRLKSGDYLLQGECRLQLYDSTGKYRRRLGRDGAGPNEFSCAHIIVHGAGDSLVVIDPIPRLATVLDSAGNFIRRFSYKGGPDQPTSFVAHPAGGGFATSWGTAEPGRPAMVWRLAQDWHNLDSVILKPFRPDVMSGLLLGPHAGGGYWATFQNAYEIVLADTSGRPIRTITRAPEWWAKRDSTKDENSQPPMSMILAIREDANGRLWVLITRPAPNWKNFRVELQGQRWFDPYTDRNDIVIEILDPRTGKALLSQTVQPTVTSFVDDSTLVGVDPDEAGNWAISLYRLRKLTRTKGR